MNEFEELLQQANAGDATAMYNLALAYHDGDGTEVSLEQFFTWIKKAADTGDTDAMFYLALAYHQGEGTPVDYVQFFKWVKTASEAGHTDAMYFLAIAYQDGVGTAVDLNQYISWITKSAEAGVPTAMHSLALAYYSGSGIPADSGKYFFWIKKAAEAGNAEAMYLLALAYDEGETTTADAAKYFSWMKKAAEAQDGDAAAMYFLAWAYREGKGTEIDLDQYIFWLKKSVENGDADAMLNLAYSYKDGIGTAVDINRFFELANRSAEAGSAEGMYVLALAHYYGDGTKADPVQFYSWMRRSAEAGDADAMRSLAWAFHEGVGTSIDLKQYFSWLQRSAETGNAFAMYYVARSYLDGEGVDVDIDLYSEWVKRAAEAGNEDAAILDYINRILDEVRLKRTELLNSLADLMDAVEEVKKGHIAQSDVSCIAHFTRFQTIEKMLPLENSSTILPAHNHLRLYNVEYLNDPHEGCRLFQFMKDSKNETYAGFYSSLFAGLDKKPFIPLIHEDLSVYVCSFTLLSDRLDLWRAYGRDGKGVCISVPLGAFEDNTQLHALAEHVRELRKPRELPRAVQATSNAPTGKETSENIANFAPRVLYLVKYEDTDIDESLRTLQPCLTTIIGLLTKYTAVEQDAVRKCTIALLSDILFLYKNQEYKSEGEARLVFAAGIAHHMLELDEQKPGKLFVKTDNFLFKYPGSRIIIGPRVSDKKAVELNLKYRLTKHGFTQTKVELSQVDYR